MSKNAIYKQNFALDNDYNIETVLATNSIDKVKNYLNDEYQNDLGLVTEQDVLNWRKRMLIVFLSCILSLGILSIFFFFFEIPWYIDIAKTQSQSYIMLIVACVLVALFFIGWFIMMAYVFNRFKKVFNARWKYINHLMQLQIINNFNNLPKAIQTGRYVNDPQGFQENFGGFYRQFNYFRFIRSVAIFHDKLKKYTEKI